MAERRSLFNQPAPNTGQLPTEGPDNGLDMVLRALTTGLGLEQQKPGDLPSAIGASAAMLPLGKLLSMLRGAGKGVQAAQEARPAVDQLLHSHIDDAMAGSRMAEFAPVNHPASVEPALDPEEALKAIELTSQRRKPQ